MATLRATNPAARDRVRAYKLSIGDSELARERFALQKRTKQLKDRLLADYPDVFSGGIRNMRLLATNIHRQIEDATGESAGVVDSFLHHWVNQDAYLRAMLNGGTRINLDGSDGSRVESQHRLHAIRTLKQ